MNRIGIRCIYPQGQAVYSIWRVFTRAHLPMTETLENVTLCTPVDSVLQLQYPEHFVMLQLLCMECRQHSTAEQSKGNIISRIDSTFKQRRENHILSPLWMDKWMPLYRLWYSTNHAKEYPRFITVRWAILLVQVQVWNTCITCREFLLKATEPEEEGFPSVPSWRQRHLA